MEKLVLIDGNSLLNRAFYATPVFTTKDGQPTNAIFGFTKLLLKIITDVKPEYLIVAFDLKAPTFRHKMYEGYKASRKGMPDELAAQVEPLEETVDTICETLRTRHIQRLKEGKCQLESGIIFLDVLTNLERISDHCSNIAARLLGMESDSELDPHALKKAMHNGDTKGYDDALNQYRKKYLQVLAEG